MGVEAILLPHDELNERMRMVATFTASFNGLTSRDLPTLERRVSSRKIGTSLRCRAFGDLG
jgi:hypothetical protein